MRALCVLVCLLASCTRPSTPVSSVETAPPAEGSLPRRPRPIDDADIGRVVADLRVTTLAGASMTLDQIMRGKRGLVLSVTSADCPIAKRYAPRLAAIEEEFEGRVAFLHVNVVEGESPETIQAFIRDAGERGLRGWYARDLDGAVRRELKPRTTTEVCVLAADRTLIYRGAIDDQNRFGGSAAAPTRHYLKDAIRAVIEGTTPAISATAAPGCLVDMPDAAAHPPSAAPIEFFPGVAGVIERNCLPCHYPGGPAPFSLHKPEFIAGRAAMVAAVVREGVMPPAHGLSWSGPSPAVSDRTMPIADRELLLAWLDSARAIGAPAAFTPKPLPTAAWEIGDPDMLIVTPGPELAADGSPKAGRYLIATNIEEDRWVRAIATRSMMRDAVEIADLWIIPPGGRLPVGDELPADAELLATFSKSDRAVIFPEGSGVLLPRGSVVVADILSKPMGKPGVGQVRIALKFADAPPARRVRMVRVAPAAIDVKPGDPDARVEASLVLDRPGRLIAVRPLMGPRGRELSVEIRSSGSTTRVLDLRRFDWRWKIRYPLVEPMDLPAGARVTLRARLDNSANNPANPDASARVTMGSGPGREVVMVVLEMER